MASDDKLFSLLKENNRLIQENNRLIKKIRRAQVWSSAFRFLTVAIVIGAPVALYYWIVGPYLAQLQTTFAEVRGQVDELRNFKDNSGTLPPWVQQLLGGGATNSSGENIRSTPN